MPSRNATAQRVFWNGSDVARWLDNADYREVAKLTEVLLARAELEPGDRVIDVGCGVGATSKILRQRVGPRGSVLGIDISRPMLAVARKHVAKVRFVEADAASYPLKSQSFQLVFSQFGMTFFDNPVVAFSRFCRALVPGGRLAFVCHGPVERNPWIDAPFVAAHELAPSWQAPRLGLGGPFAFQRRETIEVILAAADFEDVKVEGFDAAELLGDTLDQAMTRVFERPLVAGALASLDDSTRAAVRDRVRPLVATFKLGKQFAAPSAVWLVRARAPRPR